MRILVLLAGMFSLAAQASLVGDTISIVHHYPDEDTVYQNYWKTWSHVVTDPGTPVCPQRESGCSVAYQVRVDGDSIWLGMPQDFGWAEGGGTAEFVEFNGVVIGDLNDSSGNPLTGITLLDNTLGGKNGIDAWDMETMLSFTDDSVSISFVVPGAATGAVTNGWIELGLEFGAAAVPVPAAAWLFGSALAGLGWMRSKRAV